MEIGTALLAEILDHMSPMKQKITSIFTLDSMDSSSLKPSKVDDSLFVVIFLLHIFLSIDEKAYFIRLS